MVDSSANAAGLAKYWLMLQRRWMPASAAFSITFLLVAWGVSRQKPVFQAEGKLRFERHSPTPSLTGVGKEIGSLEPLAEKSNPLATEAEIIKSIPVIRETIAQLNLRNEQGKLITVSAFLKQLAVLEIKGTDILKIEYKDPNSKQAVAVVDQLMEIYLKHNVLSHRAQATAARKFLEQQLPDTEQRVAQAEIALQQFKETNQVVVLEQEANAAVETNVQLQRQIGDKEAQLAAIQGEMTSIQQQLGLATSEAVGLTALSQSSGVQSALKDLQEAEAQFAAETHRYRENHPTMQGLSRKIEDLRQLVRSRVAETPGANPSTGDDRLQMGELHQSLTKQMVSLESQQLALIQQLYRMRQQKQSYQSRARSLPKLEQQQRELERKLQAAQTTYAQLLQKASEIRIAENQNVGNAQIISEAVVEDAKARFKSVMMAAGLLGFLAAASTIALLEMVDRSVKTIEQAKKIFGFTLLGAIPRSGTGQQGRSLPDPMILPLVVRDAPRSTSSAAYRMLQANLTFVSSSDQPLQAIAITSSIPKEGKSTIAANLAAAFAQLGKTVLLVDADLHSPDQHRIWGLPNEVGLSHLLVGQATLRSAKREVLPHLDVLTAGVLPPNPSALLGSQKMIDLLEQWEAQYDFVILDTPPLSIAADAPMLGRAVDGLLMVVRPGKLDQRNALFAKGCLEHSGQRVLGMVVNDVTAKYEPDSAYYFMDVPQVPSGSRSASRTDRRSMPPIDRR